MTRRLNAPYFAKRYVGDSDTRMLHDLDAEKKECLIDTIPRQRIQMFEWINIPGEMGYSGCKYCMPGFKGHAKQSPS
jgi:hypothetical protein